jgi:hypothetical protein
MFDDFDVQIQSDEIIPEEFEDWLAMIGMTEEELQADLEAQDRWYHETFEDVSIYNDSDVDHWEDIWSDFLEQMTYAND